MVTDLDRLDVRLLSQLKQNARASYVHMAKELGVSVMTVRQRTQRLLRENKINLEVVPNIAKLGYPIEAFFGLHVRLAKSETVINELEHNSAVVYIALTSGRYDILVWAVFSSLIRMSSFIEMDLASVDGIEWSESMVHLEVKKRGWDDSLGSPPLTKDIDQLDGRIISNLHDNVRLSTAMIARRLNVSVPTVRSRLSRLVSEGVIAFSTVSDPLTLGYDRVAHIGLQVRLSKVGEILHQLVEMSNVHYIGMTDGRFDIMMWVWFRSDFELTDFLQSVLARMEGIERTETFINLRIAKWSFKDVVRAAGEG